MLLLGDFIHLKTLHPQTWSSPIITTVNTHELHPTVCTQNKITAFSTMTTMTTLNTDARPVNLYPALLQNSNTKRAEEEDNGFWQPPIESS